jgi:hypothetical protein
VDVSAARYSPPGRGGASAGLDERRAGLMLDGMDTKPPTKSHPAATARAQAEAEVRRKREAAALRENLRKRKEQARARDAGEPGSPPKK